MGMYTLRNGKGKEATDGKGLKSLSQQPEAP
jgi:hypothetical protein